MELFDFRFTFSRTVNSNDSSNEHLWRNVLQFYRSILNNGHDADTIAEQLTNHINQLAIEEKGDERKYCFYTIGPVLIDSMKFTITPNKKDGRQDGFNIHSTFISEQFKLIAPPLIENREHLILICQRPEQKEILTLNYNCVDTYGWERI